MYCYTYPLSAWQRTKRVETLPQPPFFRVHKSFIVNLDHVRLLDGNTLYVQDKLILVSDTYRDALYRVVRGGSPVGH
jgi:DNA-binding LytR/AlgR family response regulator